jgi:hypothetical protein
MFNFLQDFSIYPDIDESLFGQDYKVYPKQSLCDEFFGEAVDPAFQQAIELERIAVNIASASFAG